VGWRFLAGYWNVLYTINPTWTAQELTRVISRQNAELVTALTYR